MPLIPKHPRIAPTAPPFDDDTRAALDILGPPIALFGVFARRPDRAHAIAGWGRYYLSRRGALSLRHREQAIDRTTALCSAGYEWGIHIAVYAGNAGLTDEQRGCQYVAVLAILTAAGTLYTKTGICRGVVADAQAGTNGFGYDPIFLVPGLGKTMGEMADAEKASLSHRGRAVRQALPLLRTLLTQASQLDIS